MTQKKSCCEARDVKINAQHKKEKKHGHTLKLLTVEGALEGASKKSWCTVRRTLENPNLQCKMTLGKTLNAM